MNAEILYGLLSRLVSLRIGLDGSEFCIGHELGRFYGYVTALCDAGAITSAESRALIDLLNSAHTNASKPFPDRRNAGPVMPFAVEWDRRKESEKAEKDSRHAPVKVSETSAFRRLSVLCVLGNGAAGLSRRLEVSTRPIHPAGSLLVRRSECGQADAMRLGLHRPASRHC